MANWQARGFIALLFAATFVQTVPAYAGCPSGTVQVGERKEETDTAIIIHPICQQQEQPAAAPEDPAATRKAKKSFCQAKTLIAKDEDAIRSLGFGKNAEQFNEYANQAYNLRNEIAIEATGILFNKLFSKPATDHAKGLKDISTNKLQAHVKELYADLQEIGIPKSKKVDTALNNLTAAVNRYYRNNKKMFLEKDIDNSIDMVLKSVKETKLDIDTKKDGADKADVSKTIGALIFVGKLAVKTPWLDATITGAEIAKTALMAYAVDQSVDTLADVNDFQMKQLVHYRQWLDKDLEQLRKARAYMSEHGGEPDCKP